MEFSLRKKIVFSCVLVLLLVIVAELFLHTAFFLRNGSFWYLGEPYEVFNVREFTELTKDERIVTNRRGYRGKAGRDAPWIVETDQHGFRVGRNRYEGFSRNLIFMGDSVPFGWGANGDESYPSYFYELSRQHPALRDQGVINAAIPSYSLFQTYQRYVKEVKGRFPASHLFVQVYDPVSQFLIWGRDWRPEMSWSSQDTLTMTQRVAAARVFAKFSEYSGILFTARKVLERVRPAVVQRRLELNDEIAFRNFHDGVTSVLESLYRAVDAEGTRLVLISTNPTPKAVDCANVGSLDLDGYRACVVPIFNRTLQEFAAAHPKVAYVDVRAHYLQRPDVRSLFLDSCCHLTPEGARVEAKFLFDSLWGPPAAKAR